MKRIVAIGFNLMLVCGSFAQSIQVVDASNGFPLNYVSIHSSDGTKMQLTNSQGTADITSLMHYDSLYFNKLGYEAKWVLRDSIKAMHFIINLKSVDSLISELIVTAYRKEASKYSSLHIEPLHIDEINRSGSFNLSDALTSLPGITQLNSGIGISKPVIRGMYGSRVLVLFSGLRFDNQQWQDEHGMGLSAIGISKIEVIKGPLSILYGTGANGGVINIIEENAPKKLTRETEVKMGYHTNNRGSLVELGTKQSMKAYWYRIRLSANLNADYSDGKNQRVLNSRFNTSALKASIGFKRKKWESVNHYFSSYSRFGFVFGDVSNFFDADARQSLKMSGPHHRVFLNTFSSSNTIDLNKSDLSIDAGVQSNLRSEDEGGGALSLKMHLFTAQYNLKWHRVLSDQLEWVLAHGLSFENNLNLGRRKIVPDANTFESNLSSYFKYHHNKLILEYGIGGGLRTIDTKYTPTVNSEEKEIEPFDQTRVYVNMMLGSNYRLNKALELKLNISSGVRAPNLSELSANGLHEGIYTYEIGNPDLRNEQNITSDLMLIYSNDHWLFQASTFYNHLENYIYLQPTEEEWYGFPIYRFVQSDARIYGGESYLSYKPSKNLQLGISYAGLVGELYKRTYLPYMPAQELKPELKLYTQLNKGVQVELFANSKYVFQQKLLYPTENTTPSYTLVNLGGSIEWKRKHDYQLNIMAKNLFNTAYYNHLSRYKNYGLLNMGRDIYINLKIIFNQNLNNRKQ